MSSIPSPMTVPRFAFTAREVPLIGDEYLVHRAGVDRIGEAFDPLGRGETGKAAIEP